MRSSSFRRAFATTFASLTLVLACAGEALAQDIPEPPPTLAEGAPIQPSNSPLTSNEGEIFTQDINPAGCIGKTDLPHRSTHVPDTINVVGRTYSCAWSVNYKIRVVLYRSRWYGWELRGDSKVKPGKGRSISANAGSPRCKGDRHDWRGVTHHSSFQGATWYNTSTARQRNGLSC